MAAVMRRNDRASLARRLALPGFILRCDEQLNLQNLTHITQFA
jgi:hypothetical protein